MRKIGLLWLLSSAVVLAAPCASAQSARTKDEIVNHFAPALSNKGGFGRTRQVCIGTEATCAKTEEAAQPAPPPSNLEVAVQFAYNSDELTPDARKELDTYVGAFLDPRLAGGSFAIEGHTDATGSKEYNKGLSERRAASVVRYLAQRGVEQRRLQAQGFGSERPKVPNAFAAENRRVELRLVQ